MALVEYTEAPIREGRLESPWEGLVLGAVLGEREEARALIREVTVGVDARRMRAIEAGARTRPAWDRIVGAAEKLLNRKWATMAERYGDWGRDGTMAVAVRELGWRLVDVVKAADCVEYAAAVQGVRRFWDRAARDGDMKRFVSDLVVEASKRQ